MPNRDLGGTKMKTEVEVITDEILQTEQAEKQKIVPQSEMNI